MTRGNAIVGVTNAVNMMAYAIVVNDKRNVYDGISMKSEADWAGDTKRLLRAEMTRRGITYDQLAEKLTALGVQDSSVNIRNKVARGRFSATFLIQCLAAMGARSFRISEDTDGE